ncbi:MAG: lyase family protein [Acidimicrobiia bacterium]
MTDLPTFESGFSTPEMGEVFSAAATVEAFLEFEAGLALALADAGLAPPGEAEAVAASCRQPVADPERILAATWERGTPIIALEEEIGGRLASDSDRRWFHYGATTQDAVDTGHMIQARAALVVLDDLLVGVARRMRDLAEEFRDQPQIGRTFLQQARPTTFGLRAAAWLDEVLGHIEKLREERLRLRVQLGGSAGNMAAYGGAATEVLLALARELDLQAPDIAWHSNRSPVFDLAHAVASSAHAMEKVAVDIALLAQSEVAEITVRPGGSSSMPEKRNPIDAIRGRAAAEACKGFAAMITTSPAHELDRGVGAWHLEWLAIPMLFQSAAAAVEAVDGCLASLEVDTATMDSRVDPGDLESLRAIDPRQMNRVFARFDRVVLSQ